MVPPAFFQAHHTTSAPFIPLCSFCLIWLALLFSTVVTRAQEITGLEVVKTIEHQNYSIAAIDSYFLNGRQLIAYSNNSGGMDGDTLVIYDFAQDHVLAEVPGVIWSYDIEFVDANQLLFRNWTTVYRLVNFSAPVVTELLQDVITFAISPDKTTVALVRHVGFDYQVEVSAYNSVTGTFSTPDIYALLEEPDSDRSNFSFSADGNFIALCGGYNRDYVYIINRGTHTITQVMTPDNAGTYSPVFYKQNGKLRLAVGGGFSNGGIEVIDVDALAVEASIPVFPHYNYSLAFDLTQRYLVCGGYNDIIKLFRVDSTTFTEIKMYETASIARILFTQDNQYVISGHETPSLLMIHRVVTMPSGVLPLNKTPFVLYPNPTTGILQLDGMQDAVITIFDLHGRQVMQRHASESTLDVSGLAGGLFVLKAEDEKEVRAGMFIKE